MDFEWIPVTNLEQLPEHRHFKNVIKDQFYHRPSVSPNCNKDLTTPLNSAVSFVTPLIRYILVHTNYNLPIHGKMAATEDEIMQLILCLSAMSTFGDNFQTFGNQVASMRKTLFFELGVKADWPNKTRLQEIRSHIGTYESYDTSTVYEKIEPIFNTFNEISKDNIIGSTGWSVDGTLAEPPIEDKWNKIKYNNISMCSVRYCEKIIPQKTTSRINRAKHQKVEEILDKLVTEPNTPVCGDMGYTNLDILAEYTRRNVPYIGTVRPECLKGNRPVFPKGKADDFQKRMYIFKLKGSDVFLVAFYEHPGKAPVCFLSNFHTGDLSQNLTKPPKICTIYNRLMFRDDHEKSRIYSLSRRTYNHSVSLFELMIGNLLVNARTAYCIQNDYDMAKYTMAQFYKDILRERYTAVEIINTISIEVKKPCSKKICNWKNCRKSTTIPCANSRCEKIACETTHSYLVCCKCAKKPFDQLTICKDKKLHGSASVRVVCHFGAHCQSRTRRLCSVLGCEKPTCLIHLYKLCADCCFNSTSPSEDNLSVKLPNNPSRQLTLPVD